MRDYFEDILLLGSEVPEGTGEARRGPSPTQVLTKQERLELLIKEEPKRRQTFEQILGVRLKDNEYKLLKRKRFSPVIEKKLIQLVRIYNKHWVIRSRDDLPQKEVEGIVFHNVATGKETVIHDPDMIFDLEDMRGLFLSRSREVLKGLPPPEKFLILSIAQQVIRPNVVCDKVATEQRVQKALEEVQPVIREIRKGDVIIHKGERVTPEQMENLQAMGHPLAGIWNIIMFIGFLLITFFTIYVPYDFSLRERLCRKGFQQATKFSWERTARETLEVYEAIGR